MITAVLTAGADRGGDRVAEIAVRFVTGLVGGPPDHLLTPAHPRAAGVLIESDVVVVASPVSAEGLDSRLRQELECYRHDLRLTGLVAFALAVGSWPADGDIAESQLKPLLRAAGAVCTAPGLQVADLLNAQAPAIAAYCRYWRPAVPALVRLAKETATAVLGVPDVEVAVPALVTSGAGSHGRPLR